MAEQFRWTAWGMMREWEWLLLRKFPTLDVRWSSAVQERWWQSFDRLMAVVAHQAWAAPPGAATPCLRRTAPGVAVPRRHASLDAGHAD